MASLMCASHACRTQLYSCWGVSYTHVPSPPACQRGPTWPHLNKAALCCLLPACYKPLHMLAPCYACQYLTVTLVSRALIAFHMSGASTACRELQEGVRWSRRCQLQLQPERSNVCCLSGHTSATCIGTRRTLGWRSSRVSSSVEDILSPGCVVKTTSHVLWFAAKVWSWICHCTCWQHTWYHC